MSRQACLRHTATFCEQLVALCSPFRLRRVRLDRVSLVLVAKHHAYQHYAWPWWVKLFRPRRFNIPTHHHSYGMPTHTGSCFNPPAVPINPVSVLPRPFPSLNTKVRAEQALLTELESEWLNQFWVQGRRHAVLHPWWRGPMALVLATWRELERRTVLTVQRLMSLRDEESQGLAGGAEPAAMARAFETVLRVLEERRESRSRWALRFADPAYRSLPEDCSPVVPALWPAADSGGGGKGKGGGDGGAGSAALPRSLAGVISRLRECYTAVYRAASGGKKAGSAKAIAAGAASNWELFRAGSSAAASSSGRMNGAPNHKKKRLQGGGGGSVGGGGRVGGRDEKKRPAGSSSVVGGRTGGGGAGGRGPKRKRPSKGREG